MADDGGISQSPKVVQANIQMYIITNLYKVYYMTNVLSALCVNINLLSPPNNPVM
jgi:hypothetical protein